MAIGDFDQSDHFNHGLSRIGVDDSDGYNLDPASERRMLRVAYVVAWILFGFVFPYLDAGTMDWMFTGIISLGFLLFGLIVVIGNVLWPTPQWRVPFSDNVLASVMEAYGIDDRKAFEATLHAFDLDENGYIKRSEIEAAAEAFIQGDS